MGAKDQDLGENQAVNCARAVARRVTFILCLVVAISPGSSIGANMRSFIEAVRRKAPVVYVGRLTQVQRLTRTKFDIKARATTEIIAIARTPGAAPREATLEYSSYDVTTPMLAGGPQYQLLPGEEVIVFADSFAATIPPGYLLQGSHDELRHRVQALRDNLQKMGPDQLKINEIDEQDRRVQLSLYQSLINTLESAQ